MLQGLVASGKAIFPLRGENYIQHRFFYGNEYSRNKYIFTVVQAGMVIKPKTQPRAPQGETSIT